MATVDGSVVKPDANGVIQGNGGDVDKMAGGSGNDKLEGHADFNQYYGGAGNDTFILAAKFGQTTDAPTTVFADQAAYITDFQNASGGTNPANAPGDHDFIALTGFGEGSSVHLDHVGTSGTNGATLYYYNIYDTHTGNYYNFLVNSLNGKALGAGDFAFSSITSADHPMMTS